MRKAWASIVSVTFFSLIAYSSIASAQSSSPETPREFRQTFHTPLDFSNVELLGRNPAVVPYGEGSIRLVTWVELDERKRNFTTPNGTEIKVSGETYIGIDAQGRVLHVLQLNDRIVAYILSGEKRFSDLIVSRNDHIFGLTEFGELQQFDPKVWALSPMRRIAAAAIIRTGAIFGITSTALALAYPFIQDYLPGQSLPLLMGMVGVIVPGLEARSASRRFELANQNPDGFVPLNQFFTTHDRSEPVFSPDSGQPIDYLIGENGFRVSLTTLLPELPAYDPSRTADLTYNCQHELLPRGNYVNLF
jgi:hypothetical protein